MFSVWSGRFSLTQPILELDNAGLPIESLIGSATFLRKFTPKISLASFKRPRRSCPIFTRPDAGSPIPDQPAVQDVRSNIRRAGFFTRFGKEYKASVQLAKTWLGHDEHTKIKRADLVSELDQFWSGVKRLSNFSFASFLGFTSRSKHQLRSIRGAVADEESMRRRC